MPKSRDYKRGYKAGYAAGNQAIKHERQGTTPAPPGRPRKYPFDLLKIGDSIPSDQTDPKLAYRAGRAFARAHAPGRRYRVRPTDTGCTITRTQ